MQLSAILLLCTFPLSSFSAPVADHKRSVPNSRNLCSYYSAKEELSCDYHDSCIEGIFQCNAEGFHIGYSKPRCEAIKQLRKSSDNCESCLVHEELVNWGIATEECIQPRLQQLAKQWSNSVQPLTVPDPQHCILYEKEALEQLKNCYKENISPVCDLMSEELNEDFVTDLEKLVSSFAIGDYYKPIIHNHLREVLQECPAGSAMTTITKAIPQPKQRIMFCASVSGEDSESDIIPIIVDKLSSDVVINHDDFVYADISSNSEIRNNLCRKTSPPEADGALLDSYRLIQWSPNEIPQSLDNYYKKDLSAGSNLLFFQYSLPSSSCGNGVREAGEMCDTFGDIGNSDYGCDETCQPFDNNECSTDQLAISKCISSYCGDGMRSSLEECDDSNIMDSDGCSSLCTIEPLYECTQLSYNETSLCKPVLQQPETSSILPTVTTSTSIPSITTSVVSTTNIITSSPSIILPTVVSDPTNEPILAGSSANRTLSCWWLMFVLILSIILMR